MGAAGRDRAQLKLVSRSGVQSRRPCHDAERVESPGARCDLVGTLPLVTPHEPNARHRAAARAPFHAAFLVLVGALAWPAGISSAAGDPFAILSLESPGRTAFAELVDLDGDRRADVIAVVFSGLPPNERREVRVYFQRKNGGLPARPDWTGPLVEGAIAYDVADLFDTPGVELLFLVRRGVVVLSMAGHQPNWRELPVPGERTFAVASDERGLERIRMVHTGLGGSPRIVVPGLGEAFVMAPEGTIVGRLELALRANYFVPPRPGPLVNESEIELYLDFPRVESGDVDGDGRGDVITAQRHEIRVFLQREDGTFASAPDQVVPLGLVSETDHIRNSGTVRVAASDLDGDGLVDLVVSRTSDGLFRARSETRIHRNRGGTWNLAAPDQLFEMGRGFSTVLLVDIDSDGRPELIEGRIPLNVLEVVEILITGSIDTQLAIHPPTSNKNGLVFEEEPSFERQLEVPMSFETFRPRGFIPTFAADLNGDGYRDLMQSDGGEGLEVHLGGPDRPYRKRAARQSFDSSGRIGFGDYDGNGLADFILYDHRTPDSSLRIGINRGKLPGTGVRTPPVPPRPALNITRRGGDAP